MQLVQAQSSPHLEDKSAAAEGQKPVAADASEAAAASTRADAPKVNATQVNLPVLVRDKKGALVQTLKKDDFALAVDGHAQTVRFFELDQAMPLTLGLLVDVSTSQRSGLVEEREASSAFLNKVLSRTGEIGTADVVKAGEQTRTPDRGFILQFAQQSELLQDLTSSKARLQAAVKEIGSKNPNAVAAPVDDSGNGGGSGNGGSSGGKGSGSSGGGSTGSRQSGNTLYDSVFLSAQEVLGKQQGRKALVILSDGVDRKSRESLTKAIEMAERADTVIYAIYVKGEQQAQDSRKSNGGRGSGGGNDPNDPNGYPGGGYPGGGYPGGGYPGGGYPGGGYPGGGYPGGGRPSGGGGRGPQQAPHERQVDGRKILEQMARETGGRMFELGKNETVGMIYDEIAEEFHEQYRLGYTPDTATANAGYHKVELTTPRQKGLVVQTPAGYYSQE